MLVKPNVYKTRWGRERWFHNSKKYAFKLMEFKQGGRDGLHFHMGKTETWFVESGGFEVTTVDAATGLRVKQVVTQGAVFHFPAGVPHAIKCFARGRIFKASTEEVKGDRYSLRTRF